MNETPADKLLLNLQCLEIEEKDIDTLTDTELLKYLMDLVVHYDYLKDEELNFLGDECKEKDSAYWSEEDKEWYDDLKIKIDSYFCRIREVARKVYGEKDFWYC